MSDEKEYEKNVMEKEKVAKENMKAAEVELSDETLGKVAGGRWRRNGHILN